MSDSTSSTPEKIMASSTRKRKQIPSDDEDEFFTPEPELGKRKDKTSSKKINRRSMLEELKKKRKESVKKRLELDSDINPNSSLKGNGQIDTLLVHQELPLDGSNNYYCKSAQSPYIIESEDNSENTGSGDESQQNSLSVTESEDEDDLSGFIVQESESISSQEMGSQDSLKDVMAQHFVTLSREEAHEIYVQAMLTSLLDNDHSKSESDGPLVKKAKNIIDDNLWSKKNLVDSSAWGIEFKEMLTQCSVLIDASLSLPMHTKIKCQACRRDRTIASRSFSFYEESNGQMVLRREFLIGCFCADKGLLYHRILHYCSVELKKRCMEKLPELRRVATGEEVSAKETVQKYCTEHQSWVDKLYADFEQLLKEAQEWAIDGKRHKEMMRRCSSVIV